MLSRIRDIGIVRRVLAIGPGFVDSFLRGNKVIPPVLAVLALLIFSWVVAGIFVGEPEEERVANQANVVAQSQDDSGDDGGSESQAPQIESRDADSYAAYESKDPFRQLFAPAESTTDTNQETTGGGATTPEDTSPSGGETTGGGGETGGGGAGAGGGSSGGFQDSDDDGLSDRRETALGQDPQNPDTDADGTLDGADDADGDGVPDGRSRNTGGNGGGTGGGNGGAGGAGAAGGGSGGAGAGDDGLFDSGGSLP